MSVWNRLEKWPDRQFAITPSNTVDLPEPMVVVATTDGTVVVVDKNDVAVTYNLLAGQVAPCIAKRVNATGTTSTVVGVY